MGQLSRDYTQRKGENPPGMPSPKPLKLSAVLGPRDSYAFDFVAVGESSLDTICVVSQFPQPDEKQQMIQRLELPGGQAATAAVAAARLGWRAKYVGGIGDDRTGATIRACLRREGVECATTEKHGVPSRTAVILVDERTRRRTVLESRDDRLNLTPTDVDADHFKSGRILLVDGTDIETAHRAARVAREAGVRTLVDLDLCEPRALDLLALIDVVIVTKSFALAATRLDNVAGAAALLGERSRAAAVVVTIGEDGAVVWSQGETATVEGVEVDVVDTTGAGDAFRAGFAAAWLASPDDRPDLIEMVRFAARVAAFNCRAYGAQTGLPTMQDLSASQGVPV
jgi:sugar/nucleoside kinase (ribokinase family)